MTNIHCIHTSDLPTWRAKSKNLKRGCQHLQFLSAEKKNKSESKKRVNYITILSGDAFKSRQIAEIHVMGVMKTIDQIEIKMKMPNSSQKPRASS